MESLGYLITNKFILVAVDSVLELTIENGKTKQQIIISNAKKIFKASDSTLVSVIGLPEKVSNIYKYLEKLEGNSKSFQETIDDLESIFNTNKITTIDDINKVVSSLPKFLNSKGEVMENEIKEHYKNTPELLSILEESLRMVKSGGGLGNQILIFTGEDNSNRFGQFINIGFNMIGETSQPLHQDCLHFNLISSKKPQDEVKVLVQSKISELQALISIGWEQNPDQIQNFKEKAQEILKNSLIKLSPFVTEPNILFYELSLPTSNKFKEPDLKLISIRID